MPSLQLDIEAELTPTQKQALAREMSDTFSRVMGDLAEQEPYAEANTVELSALEVRCHWQSARLPWRPRRRRSRGRSLRSAVQYCGGAGCRARRRRHITADGVVAPLSYVERREREVPRRVAS